MPSLEETLRQNPFGPYPESVLSSDCKYTKKQPLILNDLEIILDNKPSGLNYTETLKEDHDVHFVGVLTVPTLKWLTEEGKPIVARDVQTRERLSLESIYGKKLTIRLIVVGQKRQNVVYIGGKYVPDGLQLVSEEARTFRVDSLSGACYRRSQKFLRRWRFYNLIRVLSHDISPLPTCRWLMKKLYQECYTSRFYVDGDIEPMFRLHAKWLLKENKSRKKIIDAPSWEEFLQTPLGEYRFDDPDVEMEDLDIESNSPARRTRSARKSQVYIISSEPSSPGPGAQTLPDIGEYIGSSSADEDYYVDEIPPPSSPERSPSPPPQCLIDRRIYARIPKKYDYIPLIPDSYKWDCDTDFCTHVIDLLNPEKEDLKALSPEESRVLTRKRWNLGDEALHALFAKMVHVHRLEHLRSWNIGFSEKASPPLYWIKPPYKPPPRLDKDKKPIVSSASTTYALLCRLANDEFVEQAYNPITIHTISGHNLGDY